MPSVFAEEASTNGVQRVPPPDTIGCPPVHFSDGRLNAGSLNHEFGWPARGGSDAEMALQMQLAEMKEAAVAMEEAQETREAIAAVHQHVKQRETEIDKLLCDPVWGELQFVNNTPTAFDKLIFGCCPCFIVGWACGKLCCVSDQVRASLSPRQAWTRVLSCSSLWISVLQVVVFILVVVYNGFVPMEINEMIGPHPHYLSSAGAKNAARMIYKDEWWRLMSAPNLHGGILHLLMNIIVQLKFGMLLEVLWGPHIFLLVYLVSGMYSFVASSIWLPNTLSVGSSGAICGLIGADLAFILLTWRQTLPRDIPERNVQFTALGLTVVVTAGISFVPFVDFAAHGGGFLVGALLGLAVFANRMQECRTCFRYALRCGSAVIVIGILAGSLAYLVLEVEPSRALLNLCLPAEC